MDVLTLTHLFVPSFVSKVAISHFWGVGHVGNIFSALWVGKSDTKENRIKVMETIKTR
jgi:hypothetical protein